MDDSQREHGRRKRRRWRQAPVWLAAGAVLWLLAQWPVTTRVGVDYVWSHRRIPLLEKAIRFLSRDLQTRRLAHEITEGASSEEKAILKIFSWVTENMRPVPPGFPIIDDHLLHVIIRGYGAEDQRAEVFTLLAGYAGFKATTLRLTPPGSRKGIMIALIETDKGTWAFDVVRQIVVTEADGHLVDLPHLLANPQLIEQVAPDLKVEDVPYSRYLLQLHTSRVAPSRIEAQKPWPRLRQEFERFLRGVQRYWSST